MIEIYHASTDHLDDNDPKAIDARFYLGLKPEVEKVAHLVASDIVKYIKVAEVDTDNLDLAYELTNSIHNAWYEANRPDVRNFFKEAGCRSTSMGDLLVVNNDRGWVVAAFGFTAMPAWRDLIKQ